MKEPENELANMCLGKIVELTELVSKLVEQNTLLQKQLDGKTSFQQRVLPWLLDCFGEDITYNVNERNHRFLEEALELVQSCGCTQSEAHQLVDYVFDRPVGETYQEVGGVMVSLAALCLAQEQNMHENGELELTRIWKKVDKVRQKQIAKPKFSPKP